MNISVSFPGLGIGDMSINSVAFTIGETFTVMWYGVVIALGMLMAIVYASWRCKQQGIKVDDLMDIAIYTIFFGVIGARLYYVAFSPSQFKTLLDVINLRTGGLAIYGGIIFGAATIVVVCLIKKISWRRLYDCAAPAVMIAQSMGRWGNFFNGEAYGGLVEENSPLYFLRMGLKSRNTLSAFGRIPREIVWERDYTLNELFDALDFTETQRRAYRDAKKEYYKQIEERGEWL